MRCHLVVPVDPDRSTTTLRRAVDGAVLPVAERRKRAPYRGCRKARRDFVVLGSEVGGRWNAAAFRFVQDLVCLGSYIAPPALRKQRGRPERGGGSANFPWRSQLAVKVE